MSHGGGNHPFLLGVLFGHNMHGHGRHVHRTPAQKAAGRRNWRKWWPFPLASVAILCATLHKPSPPYVAPDAAYCELWQGRSTAATRAISEAVDHHKHRDAIVARGEARIALERGGCRQI